MQHEGFCPLDRRIQLDYLKKSSINRYSVGYEFTLSFDRSIVAVNNFVTKFKEYSFRSKTAFGEKSTAKRMHFY